MSEFLKELEKLLRKHSCEDDSGTSAYILAQYLDDCLKGFHLAVNRREHWYGRRPADLNVDEAG